VTLADAAVFRADEDDGGIEHLRVRQARYQFPKEFIGVLKFRDVNRRLPAFGVAGVIEQIDVEEKQGGPFGGEIIDGYVEGRVRAFGSADLVWQADLGDKRKTIAIEEHRLFCIGPRGFQEPEDGGEVAVLISAPSLPAHCGAMVNLPGVQSLLVTPCCSGPAPLIMEAKFGKVTVGITPRACNEIGAVPDECGEVRRGVGAEDVGAEAVDGEDDHSFHFRRTRSGESERREAQSAKKRMRPLYTSNVSGNDIRQGYNAEVI
jgi:hypothetical protein